MLAPLAFVFFVMNLAETVLSGILARFDTATDELAGFGVGNYLIIMFLSPCMQLDQMAMAFGRNRRSFRRVVAVAFGFGFVTMAISICIGAIPILRQFVIVRLQGVPDEAIASRVAFILVALSPIPVLESLNRVMRGMLIRARKAAWFTSAYTIARTASIATALALIHADFIQRHPLWLPVIAYYVDGLVRLSLYLVALARVVLPRLPREGPIPRLGRILEFQYPLLLTSAMMAASRPIINAFVGRFEDGKLGLAALAIAFPLTQLFYGYVNDIRVLPQAFRGKPDNLKASQRLAVYLPVVVFAMMILLLGTPFSGVILRRVMGVKEVLIPYCRPALVVFCFFPFAVAARSYLQGVSVARRRTRAMTWSGPLRVACIVITLFVLSALGVGGATLGASALLAGFVMEAAAIGISLRRLNGQSATE